MSIRTAHLVFGAREQVRMTIRHSQSTYCGDVAGKGKLECARGEVPDLSSEPRIRLTHLHNSIAGTRREPLVSGVDSHGPNPAHMTGDHSAQFPWR